MLRSTLCAAAAGSANDQWNFWLTPKHVMELGRAVDNQVTGEQAEIDGHEFENGTQAPKRRANSRARNDLFR